MALWQYILLCAAVLIGGGLSLIGSDRWRSYLPVLLSFSGAYLLAIAALELIPDVFSSGVQEAGVWLLLGFFIQLLLEGLSQGVEHGHVHAHEQEHYGYAVQVMLGLGLHALLEGLPLGTPGSEVITAAAAANHGDHLLFGIVLHKLPAAFALGLLIRGSGYSRRFAWGCLLVFSLLSPLGAIFGEIISIDPLWRVRILAVVVGSFLHISTTILFESEDKHRHGISVRKFLVIIAGMLTAYFSTVHY